MKDKPEDYRNGFEALYLTQSSPLSIVLYMIPAGVASGYLVSSAWIAVMICLYLLRVQASVSEQTRLLIIVWVATVTTLTYLMKGMLEPSFGLISGISCFFAVLIARFTVYDTLVKENKIYIFLIMLSILTLASIPGTIFELLPLYSAKTTSSQLFSSYRSFC